MPFELGYFAIPAPDPVGARAFWSTLFDWQVSPPAEDGYQDIESTGLPGGLAPMPASHVLGWFRVDDIHAAVERVRATGGSAPEPAQFSFGWTVDCCDDQDTPFSLWEMAPGLFPPERRGDGERPGEPAYFVLSTPDPERGAAFYGAILGWEFEPAEANGYRHAANLRLPGGLAQLPRPGLHLWFRTHGIEETCARLARLGGTAGDRSASASGISCDCTDPFGVAFALWQPAPGL